MKLYIAASSHDRHQVAALIRYCRARGHQVHNWPSDPAYDNPDLLDPERIASENLAALESSDALLWIITRNSSVGAPVEFGAALALGKPVFVEWQVKPDPLNVNAHLAEWVESIDGFLDEVEKLAVTA